MANKPQKSILYQKQFVSNIHEALLLYKSVKVVGLGIFYLKEISERVGYDPKKRVKKIVPKHIRIKFKPSKTFKGIVLGVGKTF